MPWDTCNHYTPYAGYCQNKQKRPSIYCSKHKNQPFGYDKKTRKRGKPPKKRKPRLHTEVKKYLAEQTKKFDRAWANVRRRRRELQLGLKPKRKPKKWMQKASKKMKKKGTKGALHRMLHIPMNQKIPTALLRQVIKNPRKYHRHARLLLHRAQFALNIRKPRKKKRVPRTLAKLAKRHSRSNAMLGF